MVQRVGSADHRVGCRSLCRAPREGEPSQGNSLDCRPDLHEAASHLRPAAAILGNIGTAAVHLNLLMLCRLA